MEENQLKDKNSTGVKLPVSGSLSELEVKHLIFYGKSRLNDKIVLDDSFKIEWAFNFMFNQIRPDQREWIEKLFWERVVALANYR